MILPQTSTRPKVFVISYLLFWPAFIWHFFLEKKNSALHFLLKTKWRMKICIFGGTQIFLLNYNVQFFITHFVFRRQYPEFFFSKKKFVKWKQVKITNMILQRLQVLCSSVIQVRIDQELVVKIRCPMRSW